MKIKEVIEKTGLTDRAIRLYINEGLAAPSIEKSYSGRKSIEFSAEDVERLNNVAMLRKAGFSIQDIKSIVDDKKTAKEIVEKFIEQTERNIEHETEIVEKLKGISFDEEVTLETICNSLSETVEEKQVPSEDIKLTTTEKVLKIVLILLSCPMIAFAVWIFALCCSGVFDVRYIKLTDNPGMIIGSLFYLGWVVIAGMLITVIFKNTGKRFNRKTKGSSWALFIFSAIGSAFLSVFTFFFIFCTVTPFYSQTTDPENYLKLDSSIMRQDEKFDSLNNIFKVFPRKIPFEVKTTYPDSIKYFYEYTPCWDGYFGTYDICAEWILPAYEYEKAKKNLPSNFILEDSLIEINHMDKLNSMLLDYLTESVTKNSGYNAVQKGDWTLIYYEGYGKVSYDYVLGAGKEPEKHCEDELLYEETKDEFKIKNWDGYEGENQYRTRYDFLICAYNDREQKVRYIASACCGHANRKGGPYYLSLDW